MACLQVQDSEMQEARGTGDLLTLLLEAKHEDGRPAFSKQEVHDEVCRGILPWTTA